MTVESNLPATRDAASAVADADPEDASRSVERPVSVAFLPLGLVVFLVLAFVIAAWTFLHAAL